MLRPWSFCSSSLPGAPLTREAIPPLSAAEPRSCEEAGTGFRGPWALEPSPSLSPTASCRLVFPGSLGSSTVPRELKRQAGSASFCLPDKGGLSVATDVSCCVLVRCGVKGVSPSFLKLSRRRFVISDSRKGCGELFIQ